ncbi:hypothetical protein B4U80_08091, partial [Leptotrombidium deliense]
LLTFTHMILKQSRIIKRTHATWQMWRSIGVKHAKHLNKDIITITSLMLGYAENDRKIKKLIQD